MKRKVCVIISMYNVGCGSCCKTMTCLIQKYFYLSKCVIVRRVDFCTLFLTDLQLLGWSYSHTKHSSSLHFWNWLTFGKEHKAQALNSEFMQSVLRYNRYTNSYELAYLQVLGTNTSYNFLKVQCMYRCVLTSAGN